MSLQPFLSELFSETLSIRTLSQPQIRGDGPASVAQLDARPTGDQEVADSTPVWSATFFRGDLIMKYFLWSFSPFC